MATMEDYADVDSHDLMNPVLWENLPRDLLVLILARLPVFQITRLRCHLSKEWTMNIEFNQACNKANPNMAVFISYPLTNNEFLVKIFDFTKYIWLYVYCFHLIHREKAPNWTLVKWKLVANDGGLVCFISTNKYTKANPLYIVVFNPLTRIQYELPPLQYVYTTPPTLVHMKVDSKTKRYKVIVISKMRGWHTLETYDSVLKQWSKAVPSWGFIWGRACKYQSANCNFFHLKSSYLSTYDFEQGQLEFLDCKLLFQLEGACMMQFALVGDRMFVLYKKLNQDDVGSGFYFISEYQSQNNGQVWALVKTYNQCFSKEKNKSFDLHACEDVVVVRDRFNSTNENYRFMNFSTNKWHNFLDNSHEDQYVSLMCRVFWDVIP